MAPVPDRFRPTQGAPGRFRCKAAAPVGFADPVAQLRPSAFAFAPASAVLKPEARARVVELGHVLAETTAGLPGDTRWVLRIDGHTDPTSVGGKVFTSNRALSQARALTIVNALAEGGLPQSRLAAFVPANVDPAKVFEGGRNEIRFNPGQNTIFIAARTVHDAELLIEELNGLLIS